MTQLRLLLPDSPIVETSVQLGNAKKVPNNSLMVRPPVAIVAQSRTRGKYALPPTPSVIYLPCKQTQALEVVTLSHDTVTNTKEMGRIIDHILGIKQADKFWDMVVSCFEQMEIAEDEIAKGMRRVWPDEETAARIWGCFRTCRTRFPLNDVLFRPHCREIVQRAIDNKLHFKKDREPATVAELLHVMVQTSLATPLNEQGGRLYWELFKTALPEEYQKIARSMRDNNMNDSEWLPREDFRGATTQLMADLQHKYSWERDECRPRLPSNPDVLEAILHAG